MVPTLDYQWVLFQTYRRYLPNVSTLNNFVVFKYAAEGVDTENECSDMVSLHED